MNEEIIFCGKCRSEYEVLFDDEQIIRSTFCKCYGKLPKKLDSAFKKLDELLQRRKCAEDFSSVNQGPKFI